VTTGVTGEIDRLADEFWDASLQADPVQGTAYGEHRYGDRLPDITVEGRAALGRRFADLRARALATAAPDDHEAALTRVALIEALDGELATLAADAVAHTVDAMSGPQAMFMDIPSYQPLRSEEDGAAMLGRWRAMGPWIDELVVQLRRGRRPHSWTSPRTSRFVPRRMELPCSAAGERWARGSMSWWCSCAAALGKAALRWPARCGG